MNTEDIPEGIGYFDFEIEVEPGFVIIKPKGLVKLLHETGEVRVDAEGAEDAGLLLLRSAALAMALDSFEDEDEETNEEEEPPLGEDPQKK